MIHVSALRWPKLAAVLALLLMTTACAVLPNTDFLSERYVAQAAQFASARGTVSAAKSAAIVAGLKRQSGDLDILDKQIALEQAIVGSPLVLGNKVVLLEDGPATYAAMFAAIRQAKDHINIESYIIEDDAVGHQFSEALMERQLHGVQVNLIYDSIGAWGIDPAFFARLSQAGVNVLEFNPVNPLNLKKAWSPNHRDHRKLLVVDGHTAILGGINISSVYSRGSALRGSRAPVDPARGWRDSDVLIEGPVVAEFQKLFMDTWEKQHGHALAPKNYFPQLVPVGKDIVRAIGSTPDAPFSQIYLTLISAISNAEQQVFITNAYFVPDPQLVTALVEAAQRGVDVRLMLPSQSDSALAYFNGRSHYETLLQSGVKIYERHGALLHAKTAMVDGVWSCVGSSNLDWRSALDNDEVNAVILGHDFGERMRAAFFRDMASADEMTPGDWAQRPGGTRFKEWAASLWARLL